MVVYILSIQADLDGVASLAWASSDDGAPPDLCVSVRHPVDHTQVRERIVIDRRAFEPAKDAAGPHAHKPHHAHVKHAAPPCHVTLHWDHDSERGTIRVLDNADDLKRHKVTTQLATSLTESDSGSRVIVLALECQHVEPYALHLLGTEFVVTTPAGQNFEQLEWDNAGNTPCSWTAYDLASGSTSITNLRATFE